MEATTDADEIETGNSNTNEYLSEGDAYGYADDGEFAVVWEVVADELAEEYSVEIWHCEAGDYRQNGRETFDPTEFDNTVARDLNDKGAMAVAEELADVDPEEAIRLARETFDN